MIRTYDAIVLGTGGVGSAALMHLAQRGLSVLGIDRLPLGHDRGSSHGHSRAIRQAYFEHPDYVPLLRAAYDRWDQLEHSSQQSLFQRVGLLEVGPPDGIVVPGVLHSAHLHGLNVLTLTHAEARQRYPGFHFPDDAMIVFEPDAGYLLVEDCVRAHVEVAQRFGAELVQEPVTHWRAEHDSVVVQTATAEYQAARLVIAAGAWARQVLHDLRLPLHVVRKHLHWYTSNHEAYRQDHGCPVYFFEVGKDFFYGFPQFDQRGVKVAEHTGLDDVVADPLTASRAEHPADRTRVDQFVTGYMPQLGLHHTDHAVCFYTMSPDEHFIVDHHPMHSQVVLAAGLSGHGFKFTSVLGAILADLVIAGSTSLPIDFLRLGRFK